jgi:5'-methylthioadenosine phosphorylase
MVKVAIIGGTGLENPGFLKNPKSISMKTPFGDPSSRFLLGRINGVEVAILSRHSPDHSIPPTQVNNKANIYSIKEIGCTHIIATTACGSLRDEIERGDLVILDQFIDFTRQRKVTFFERFFDGDLKHTSMADPFDEYLRNVLIDTAKELNLKCRTKGTVITIEGPRFSTRAESNMYRIWGADVVNMSTAPEAILANELSIPYAAVAMSTDYDCWKTNIAPVTWEEIVKVFNKNVKNVIDLLINALPKIK